jgi:hypothetical protein
MPNFKDLRRETRLTMKRTVAEFLKDRLGVAGYAACTIHAKAHDTVFSTFGVPRYLEGEFKDWARTALLPLIPADEAAAASS